MSNERVAAIVLAAGMGTRMRSTLPKVMHPVGHLPMLGHVLHGALQLGADPIVTVIGPGMDTVEAYAQRYGAVALQEERLGTGHAVKIALPTLEHFLGSVLVLYGDTPLITPSTLLTMLSHHRNFGAAVTVLGFKPPHPGMYGRLKTNTQGELEAIVECKDANDEERAIRLCNSGVMCIDATLLRRFIPQISNQNAKKEFYLTDLVALVRREGLKASYLLATEEEVLGVNTRAELSYVEHCFQRRKREEMMEKGVTLLAPETVFFSHDTQIESDVILHPNVVFGPGVSVAKGTEIRSFSHIEGASIGTDCIVGPFARLRPGTVLSEKVKIGNFVEVKNSVLSEHAQASHLSYIGDSDIGAFTNIGAGTITCNYDGYVKHRTTIGSGCFIGSDTTLVAPVTLGNGVVVVAGTTITENVEEDALVLSRSDQKMIAGGGKKYREKRETSAHS